MSDFLVLFNRWKSGGAVAPAQVNYTGATINPGSAGNGIMDLQYDGTVTDIGTLTLKTTYGGTDYTITSYTAVIHTDDTIVRVTLTGTVATWQGSHGIKVSNDGSGNIAAHTDTTTLTNNCTDDLLDTLTEGWKLDAVSGTRAAIVNSGDNLTDNNTVTQRAGAGAATGNAASFDDATSESLSVAANARVNLGDIDFTWLGWCYLDDKTTSHTWIAQWLPTGDQRAWEIFYYVTDDKWRIAISSLGTAATLTGLNSTEAAAAGAWVHLAARYDATANTIEIIVNGVSTSTGHSGGAFASSTSPLEFGAAGGGGQLLDGGIDDVYLYKRKLSDAEILSHKNGTAGNAHPFTPT